MSLPPAHNWQSGREQRVRALEAALEAATARQSQAKRQTRHDADYGTMLDSEGSDSDSRTRGGADPDSDGASCSSSVLYSEGQPLLCTYQPPAPLDASAAPPAGYGLLRASVPAKTPDTYLPWNARLRGSLWRMCAIGNCCCSPPAS
ncbi:hypothetical protein GGI20_001752 [Coemansia sp. BCRC 34301]|nr:hypothetical protein GGI20_001752 [Coemansia sp. BCRC 34301]